MHKDQIKMIGMAKLKKKNGLEIALESKIGQEN